MANFDWNKMTVAASINLENGDRATGFIMRNNEKAFIVTPRHSLFKEIAKDTYVLREKFAQIIQPVGDIRDELFNQFSISFDECSYLYDPYYDVCIIDLLTYNAEEKKFEESSGIDFVENNGTSKAVNISKVIPFRNLLVSEDVYIVGYPTSLGKKNENELPQFNYHQPLLKKGVISNIYQREKTIILDSSAYYGSSGSPIFTAYESENRIINAFVGMVIQSIPFVQTWHNLKERIVNYENHNSTFSVALPSDAIINLINQFPSTPITK